MYGGILFNFFKRRNFVICDGMMNFNDIMPGEMSQSERTNQFYLHNYLTQKIIKKIEILQMELPACEKGKMGN